MCSWAAYEVIRLEHLNDRRHLALLMIKDVKYWT